MMNQLIFAASETNADLRYLTNFFAPDPFVYLKLNGKTFLLLSDLEVDRGRRQATVNQVVAVSDLRKKSRRSRDKKKPATLAELIGFLCQSKQVSKLYVPSAFPLGLAMELSPLGLELIPRPNPFARGRLRKSTKEIAAIAAVQRANEKAMAAAYELLRESDIRSKDQILFIGSQPLTAELVKQTIELALLKENCLALNTIVACGSQTADPHDRGSGPLYAGQPIIVDIFPSSKETGYFADMTRTFCKGRAPDRLKRLYNVVRKGQDLALRQIKAGVNVTLPDKNIRRYFAQAGYPTKKSGGRMVGFFHGVGHGVGLEIHEPPSLSPRGEGTLKLGMVVTVEPGLYYPWGGVRLEDLVVLTSGGLRNLTNFPKMLEV